MSLSVGLIQIDVTDLEEALRFYVETLQLRGEKRLGPGKPFQLEVPGGPPLLVYRVERMVERRYPDDTGITLVFHTTALRATVDDWSRRGVEFIPIGWSRDPSGIAATPFGPFIAFRDPFGNVHELLQPE